MQQILLISHFGQSGWGKAGLNLAECLNSNPNIDLACRRLALNEQQIESPLLDELLNKDIKNRPYCIQLLLPHCMEYAPFKKCIGMFFNESDNYELTSWPTSLNMMDEVWVPYPSQAHVNSGIQKSVRVINSPVDIEKYKKTYTKLNLPVEGNFVFYFIGELNKRKNLSTLIKAFHIAFDTSDNVGLVIKTSEPGRSPQETAQKVIDIASSIKSGLKLRNKYKNEIIITDRLSEEDMNSLHASCHCFVSPSHGEAINLPLMDAIGFGKRTLVSNSHGMRYIYDILDMEREYRIIGNNGEYVFGMTDTFDDLFTAHETWFEPSLKNLVSKMRHHFNWWSQNKEHYESIDHNKNYYKRFVENFSYKAVSNQILEALNDE